jgi:LPS export ABC transporter protein LptC
MRDTLLPTASLVLLLIAVVGCSRSIKPLEHRRPAANLPSQTVGGFKLTETQMGRKSWVLVAEQADTYEEKQLVDLTRLKIDFYRSGGDSISATLTAERGNINTLSRDMAARDRVVIVSCDSLRLTADSIHWNNRERVLRTGAPVRLERGSDWLTGEGLEASSDLKEITILRNVQGKKELLNVERLR